ncbi:MAG: zinc-ribbon domain-containing protein [Coprobacillus sp.]|nr:zinc-ribbon domain-containing protein [Coprobacillus sp.]
MKYCTKCGRELPDDAKFCPRCGNPIPDDQNVVYVTSPTPNSSTYSGSASGRNGLALAGFICTLVSIVGIGSILVAIVGLVLCLVARNKKDQYLEWNAFIKPGIILGIISICLFVIELIIAIVLIVTLV